jgi:hypothetical protein
VLASLFDECVRETIARVQLSAALLIGRDAILSMFKKSACHKGFCSVVCRIRDGDYASQLRSCACSISMHHASGDEIFTG